MEISNRHRLALAGDSANMVAHRMRVAIMGPVNIMNGYFGAALRERFEHRHHRGQTYPTGQEDDRTFDMIGKEKLPRWRGHL